MSGKFKKKYDELIEDLKKSEDIKDFNELKIQLEKLIKTHTQNLLKGILKKDRYDPELETKKRKIDDWEFKKLEFLENLTFFSRSSLYPVSQYTSSFNPISTESEKEEKRKKSNELETNPGEVEAEEIMGAVESEKNEKEREILSRELEMFDENLKELLKEEKLGENKEKYLNDIQDSLLFLATNKLKKYPSFYKEIMDWAKENDDKIKSKRGGRKRKTRKLQKKKKTIKKRKQGGKRKTKKN